MHALRNFQRNEPIDEKAYTREGYGICVIGSENGDLEDKVEGEDALPQRPYEALRNWIHF